MLKPYENYVETIESWCKNLPSNWKFSKIRHIFYERNEKNNPIVTDYVLSLSARYGVVPYGERIEKGGNKLKNDLSKYKIAQPGDILVNCMNVVSGSSGLSKWEGAISPVYYALHLRSDDNVVYFEYIFRLKSFYRGLLRYSKGILMHESENGNLNTVRMRISMTSMNNICLPVPPREEQDKIVLFLDWKLSKINKLINAKKKQIELLKEQKQAIINKAVTKGIDDNVPMKDSEIMWLGSIPTHWMMNRLSKVCRVNASISHLTSKYEDDDHLVFLPMENVSVNGVITCSEKRKYIDVKSGYSSFARNDVIVAKITPCFENGKGAYLNDLETDIGYGSTEFVTLRSVQIKLLPEYLYYITKSDWFRKLGAGEMTGSAGQKRVSSDFISNFTIGIPDIEEQLKIIKHVKNIQSKLDIVISGIISEMEFISEYKTSLISSVVTGKVDVRDVVIPDFDTIEYIEDVKMECDNECTMELEV